jgi:putative ABC transport system ATP-binding protein
MVVEQAVHISGLSYSWPTESQPTLEIPELKVAMGARLFVQGSSGSGKSTLLSLLAGVVVPQQGSIDVLGESLHTRSSTQRDRFRADHLGYIFQQFNLVPYLTVLENVTLPCRFSRRRRARVKQPEKEARRLLDHLGMSSDDLIDKSVTALSVGQQQRVAAARALMGSPQLIIADEPTSALDADNREAFIQLLFKECQREGSTLLFVSHDRRLAPLFDRTVTLQHGKLSTGGVA